MCSNVKKSPKKDEIVNNVKNDKNNNINNNQEEKPKVVEIITPVEEEFKDMEEWEG